VFGQLGLGVRRPQPRLQHRHPRDRVDRDQPRHPAQVQRDRTADIRVRRRGRVEPAHHRGAAAERDHRDPVPAARLEHRPSTSSWESGRTTASGAPAASPRPQPQEGPLWTFRRSGGRGPRPRCRRARPRPPHGDRPTLAPTEFPAGNRTSARRRRRRGGTAPDAEQPAPSRSATRGVAPARRTRRPSRTRDSSDTLCRIMAATSTTSLNLARRESDLACAGRRGSRRPAGGGARASPVPGSRWTRPRRGLSVAALDAHDLAFGTSRWSSKLVHGGLRYLARGQVGIALESARERGRLLEHDRAPPDPAPCRTCCHFRPMWTRTRPASTAPASRRATVLRRVARTSHRHRCPRPRRISPAETLRLRTGAAAPVAGGWLPALRRPAGRRRPAGGRHRPQRGRPGRAHRSRTPG
jgi:hypothetical protein